MNIVLHTFNRYPAIIEMSTRRMRSERDTQASQRSLQRDSDDEDESTYASQRSNASCSQAIGGLSDDQFERLVSSTVYYMLVVDHKKYPIKKSDINKLVLKEYSRSFSRIFIEVKNELKNIFGIEVIELEGKRPPQFMLRNVLDVNPEARHCDLPDADDKSNLGLLSVVLSVIYMSGNRITESALWQGLQHMGLSPAAHHRDLGDIQKMLTKDFVRQLYLEHTRVPESDPPAYEFTWGSRATLEISKMNLLNVVCKVYGNVKPEQWVTQCEDATQQKI